MKKEKFTTFGYMGRWSDGRLGWSSPRHLFPNRRSELFYSETEYNEGQEAFLCKITVEAIPMKRKRYFGFGDIGVKEQRQAMRKGWA